MCLILFAISRHTEHPFVLAANRDEFYNRPTAPMAFWEDRPRILAGRDLQGNGTWFGITRQGKFAGLTNFRDPANMNPAAPSRGDIIVQYLQGDSTPDAFLSRLSGTAGQYNGFNLLAGQLSANADPKVYWFASPKGDALVVPPGIHGLSNRFLNSPWPKVETGKKGLAACIESSGPDDTALFDLLSDTRIAPDDSLPDTGVGPDLERMLSPLFIRSPGYGTRSSTLLRLNRQGRAEIVERTYDTGNPDRFTDRSFLLDFGSTDP